MRISYFIVGCGEKAQHQSSFHVKKLHFGAEAVSTEPLILLVSTKNTT